MLSVIIHLLKVIAKFFRFCSFLQVSGMKELYTYHVKQTAGWSFMFMIPKPIGNYILTSYLIWMYYKTEQVFQDLNEFSEGFIRKYWQRVPQFARKIVVSLSVILQINSSVRCVHLRTATMAVCPVFSIESVCLSPYWSEFNTKYSVKKFIFFKLLCNQGLLVLGESRGKRL